ncbi:MAG: hypothetical protein QOK20_2389 [Acidimicrobiaceae bacterium]|nr:hypothetical protein [Acidimicrobiaceae bacterium]
MVASVTPVVDASVSGPTVWVLPLRRGAALVGAGEAVASDVASDLGAAACPDRPRPRGAASVTTGSAGGASGPPSGAADALTVPAVAPGRFRGVFAAAFLVADGTGAGSSASGIV